MYHMHPYVWKCITCIHMYGKLSQQNKAQHKSMFGMCGTPWPAEISIQEQRWMQFLASKWWPSDLEGQGHWPPFSIQAKFPRILSQNGQNDFEGQGQWPPFSIPAESIPGCMFDANLVILAHYCDKLWRGQAGFPRILSQNGQNDLEGQSQWPLFSKPA